MIRKIFAILFILLLSTQVLPVRVIAGYVVYGKEFSIEKDLKKINNLSPQQTFEEEIKEIMGTHSRINIQDNIFLTSLSKEYVLLNSNIIPSPHLDRECPPPNSIV